MKRLIKTKSKQNHKVLCTRGVNSNTSLKKAGVGGIEALPKRDIPKNNRTQLNLPSKLRFSLKRDPLPCLTVPPKKNIEEETQP
jgi:hypothetical protein